MEKIVSLKPLLAGLDPKTRCSSSEIEKSLANPKKNLTALLMELEAIGEYVCLRGFENNQPTAVAALLKLICFLHASIIPFGGDEVNTGVVDVIHKITKHQQFSHFIATPSIRGVLIPALAPRDDDVVSMFFLIMENLLACSCEQLDPMIKWRAVRDYLAHIAEWLSDLVRAALSDFDHPPTHAMTPLRMLGFYLGNVYDEDSPLEAHGTPLNTPLFWGECVRLLLKNYPKKCMHTLGQCAHGKFGDFVLNIASKVGVDGGEFGEELMNVVCASGGGLITGGLILLASASEGWWGGVCESGGRVRLEYPEGVYEKDCLEGMDVWGEAACGSAENTTARKKSGIAEVLVGSLHLAEWMYVHTMGSYQNYLGREMCANASPTHATHLNDIFDDVSQSFEVKDPPRSDCDTEANTAMKWHRLFTLLLIIVVNNQSSLTPGLPPLNATRIRQMKSAIKTAVLLRDWTASLDLKTTTLAHKTLSKLKLLEGDGNMSSQEFMQDSNSQELVLDSGSQELMRDPNSQASEKMNKASDEMNSQDSYFRASEEMNSQESRKTPKTKSKTSKSKRPRKDPAVV